MNETTVKRREWVKNAAIVFLAFLLVLTLFSNTIRNRSLPEVAVQYTTSGSVSGGIRVSGTVNASNSYSITADSTRTVELHVQRMKKKLGWEDCLKPVFAIGYRLEV